MDEKLKEILRQWLVKGDNDLKTAKYGLQADVAKCSDYDSDFGQLQRFDFLTSYAVSLRYPDDFYMPELDETNEALIAALDVRSFVIAKLGMLDVC